MNFSAALGRYGAKLENVQWSVSAMRDWQSVVSCWSHYLEPVANDDMPYVGRLSRWSGPGSSLLHEDLIERVSDFDGDRYQTQYLHIED